MITINKEQLEKEINSVFKQMRFHPAIEQETIALLDCNGIQLQVVLTKDVWQKIESVAEGLAQIER